MPGRLVCRVWSASLTELRESHLDLLSSPERTRREGFARTADRDRFTLGATLLRIVAAAEVSAAPDRLVVDRKCPRCPRPHGRPLLTGHDLHVSVSHSGDLVAVAATAAGPVGVDIEKIVDLDYLPLLRHVLAPVETGTVATRTDFFAHWVRKESILKATGDGLRTPMTQVVVEPGATLVRYGHRALAATTADLAPMAGYAGSVTVLAPGHIRIEERCATALLALW